MSDFFPPGDGQDGIPCAKLQTIFDAEQSTPDLIDEIAKNAPMIRDALSALRESLPLAPNCSIGKQGLFLRFPNHYRSVCFALPSETGGQDSEGGAIVFKGTEPLIGDFPAYLEWMLSVGFRGAPFPMGLHFPLDVRIPPGAMLIGECLAEQVNASKLQTLYLKRHGRLARLPVPLFVFKMTPQQTEHYEDLLRSKLPAEAMRRIKSRLAAGIGVEVYYYPGIPMRVADLAPHKNPEAASQRFDPEAVIGVISRWAALFSEMVCLDHMPYAPWNHGMGACSDAGNACIDGGFSDLLTLVPFGAIATNALFSASLTSSIKIVAETAIRFVQASLEIPASPDPEAQAMVERYFRKRLLEEVDACENAGIPIDAMLKDCLKNPDVTDIIRVLRTAHDVRARSPQYQGSSTAYSSLIERATQGG